MAEAVTIDEEGPKINPDAMEADRIYHCVYKDRVLLFFIDEQKFLNCYEIEEPALVEKARQAGNIEEALKEYAANLKP